MESPEQRAARHRRRATFGEIADRYDRYRPGYAPSLVDALVATARLRAASTVLEVGCGTGQLAELLASRSLRVTALDVGTSMIAAARRRVGPGVVLHVSSFEDFDAAADAFDLVVSVDAFHWVDPEVRYEKASHVLRSSGWLAVVLCDERYEEPLQGAIVSMWVARSEDGVAWWHTPKATVGEEIAASGCFGPVVESVHEWELVRSPDEVVELEATRATALDWDAAARHRFSDELRAAIGGERHLRMTRRARLVMAQREGRRAGR